MKITYLGSGAAEGVPAMFCSCPFCMSLRGADKSQYRTRSQLIIDGEISIDFPPDAYAHALAFNVDLSAIKYLLVTHSHMDHFYAHDFILRGYKYSSPQKYRLAIYGNAEVKNVYDECTRREMRNEVSGLIDFTTLHSFNEISVGDYRILTLPAEHGTVEEALLYYVEKGGKGYLHLCDTGALSDRAVSFLAEKGAHADLITFDCTFLDAMPKAGTRHMCVEDNMAILRRLMAVGVADTATKSVITHFSHNARPSYERVHEAEKKYNVTAAYDGLVLEI